MNIYALSTGRGPSGIAIVRISGKGTLKVFNPDKTMQVEVFPCVKETEIKLPDGRALHLRKAI